MSWTLVRTLAFRSRRLRYPLSATASYAVGESPTVHSARREQNDAMSRNPHCHRPFERHLPGGGFVAIEVTSDEAGSHNRVYHGRVVVERRAVSRRDGHQPPVIATASGATVGGVIDQLLSAAQSNATIGAALLRLERFARSETLISGIG